MQSALAWQPPPPSRQGLISVKKQKSPAALKHTVTFLSSREDYRTDAHEAITGVAALTDAVSPAGKRPLTDRIQTAAAIIHGAPVYSCTRNINMFSV